MCDDRAVIVHDKAVALAVDACGFNDLLNVRRKHINRNDIGTVREMLGKGDHHFTGLRIEIRRNDDKSVFLLSQTIPVTRSRFVIRRRHPFQSVKVFSGDIAVQSGIVPVELSLVPLGFQDQIVPDDCIGLPVFDHEIHRVSSCPEHAFVCIKIISKAR